MSRESRQIGESQDKMHPLEVDGRFRGVIVTAARRTSPAGFDADSVGVKLLFVMIVDYDCAGAQGPQQQQRKQTHRREQRHNSTPGRTAEAPLCGEAAYLPVYTHQMHQRL